MKLTLKIFILFILFFNTQLRASEWDKLFDYSQYQNAKISPDGAHLAVAINHEDKTILIFLDRETMKAVGSARLGGSYEVGNYSLLTQ